MNLSRKRFLLPKTEGSDSGQIQWLTGMFFFLILVIMMNVQLQVAIWHSASQNLEDALAASNLASALINIQKLGKKHQVEIVGAEEAYAIYREAVKENLCLNEEWEPAYTELISGPVEITDYIIYNVKKNKVEAVRVGRNGQIVETLEGQRGIMRAPDNSVIECPGIYSEISFPVRGFLGITVVAHKGKLVDIVSDLVPQEEPEQEEPEQEESEQEESEQEEPKEKWSGGEIEPEKNLKME